MMSFIRKSPSLVALSMAALFCLASIASPQVHPEFHHLHGGVIEGLYFLDSNRGWTAEDGGRIRYTTDGGVDWNYATIADSTSEIRVPLRGVFVMQIQNDLMGWAVGDGGVVLRTVPGTNGQSWMDGNPTDRVRSSRDDPPPCGGNLAELFDIVMLDPLNGWVVGNDGAIRVTSYDGSTWTTPPNLPAEFGCGNNPRDAYVIHFFSDSSYQNGVIASEYGDVYTTVDGGASWQAVDLEAGGLCPTGGVEHDNLELWSLSFDDPASSTSPGWIVGGRSFGPGFILHTTGGGLDGTWSQSSCFQFMDPTTGIGNCGIGTQ